MSKVKENLPNDVVERIERVAPQASLEGIRTLLLFEKKNMKGDYLLELNWLYGKVTGGQSIWKLMYKLGDNY